MYSSRPRRAAFIKISQSRAETGQSHFPQCRFPADASFTETWSMTECKKSATWWRKRWSLDIGFLTELSDSLRFTLFPPSFPRQLWRLNLHFSTSLHANEPKRLRLQLQNCLASRPTRRRLLCPSQNSTSVINEAALNFKKHRWNALIKSLFYVRLTRRRFQLRCHRASTTNNKCALFNATSRPWLQKTAVKSKLVTA